jgi:LmbE family N-acetylglucosaminyl deacetylase
MSTRPNKFNKDDLDSTLLKLIKDYRPDKLRTQDTNSAVLWDHSDHRAVASLVERAHMRYTAPHNFISYVDYIDLLYFPNVPDADFVAKQNAFSAYAAYDSEIGCYTCFYNPYFYWLKRQYISNISRRLQGKRR